MTAFVLPNLDESTIKELRKRIPDMSEIDLPSLERVGKDVGKTADQAIDRLMGRSRTPVWPWVAGSIAFAAILGAVAAWFTWFRRPASMDTLVDEEIGTWEAPSSNASDLGTGSTDLSGTTSEFGGATDQAIDRSTNGAIGTFGDSTAEGYPVREA